MVLNVAVALGVQSAADVLMPAVLSAADVLVPVGLLLAVVAAIAASPGVRRGLRRWR